MATLQFSNTTTRRGIIQSCERNTLLGTGGISGDTNLLKDFTARVNAAGSYAWSIIFNSFGWKYDDGNYTDLPQSSQTLTSGQEKYALPSDALTVDRVEVKDAAGNYIQLTSLVEPQLVPSVDEYLKNANTPYGYRLLGETIEIFPASNYTLASGLKVYFGRSSVEFDYDDTTETPGFASDFHEIIPTHASLDWLYINKPNSNTIAHLEKKLALLSAGLKNFYDNRWRDHSPKLRPKNRQRFAF